MRPQKHDTFSKEFREEAGRQAREERRPLTRLARDLGVKYSTLRLWVKQAKDPETEPPGHDLVAENRRLRAENHQLRLEREILRKATVIFANWNQIHEWLRRLNALKHAARPSSQQFTASQLLPDLIRCEAHSEDRCAPRAAPQAGQPRHQQPSALLRPRRR